MTLLQINRGKAIGLLAVVAVLAALAVGLRLEAGAQEAQAGVPGLALQPVASGFTQPVQIVASPDGTGRLFVLERAGRISIVQDGQVLPQPYLDLTPIVGSRSHEQGLLGLAFHADFVDNGYFFVNYTNPNGDTVVARYQDSWIPNVADPGTGIPIMFLRQPAGNHNGGNIVFGPDGYLWIGTGDGGGAGDRFGNAQNGQSLLGKMLRIDVTGEWPYEIPDDNPFLGDPSVRPEIWAVGLRNPWRYSFDRLTDDLYIGDVGQNAYEEINLEPAGSAGGLNYGWPIMEASHCHPAWQPCDRTGLELPIAEYSIAAPSPHCAVTGGYVYRGEALPQLYGTYLFADYCSGRVWGLQQGDDGAWAMSRLMDVGTQVSSFGEDEAGELYVVGFGNGVVYRLVAEDLAAPAGPAPGAIVARS